MNMPAWPLGQPVADDGGLVRGIVVPDQMHVEVAWDVCFDLIEEVAKLGGTVTRVALADHRAGGDIKGGKQGCRAMAGIVMAAPLWLSRFHRQYRLAAIQ